MNPPRLPRLKLHSRWSLTLFAVLAAIYGTLTIWLHANGHAGDFDTQRWAKILATVAADEFRLEEIGLLYPHAPIYLLTLFRALPGLADERLPFFLSVLAIAATLTLWNTHLRNKGYRVRARTLLLALVGTHPYVLWSTNSGFHNALTFLMFYVFCYGCYLVVYLRDVRSLVFVAMSLSVFFFTDERTLYIFLALLPLIPLLAPGRMLRESMASVYGVLAFPVALSVAAWFYLNWLFHANPSLFLDAPEATFRGAWHSVSSSPWLMAVGGDVLTPVVLPLLISAAAFPLPMWLLWTFRHHDRFLRAALVLFLHPVIALALATSAFYLAHPAEILYLMAAVTMGLVLVAPRLESHLPIILMLLAAGNVGGWIVLAQETHRDVVDWRNSLLARPTPEDGSDRRLGRWLDEHRAPTLIDDRAAYAAVVARGDALRLILPHQAAFKRALRQRDWAPEQVVVLRPGHERANRDAITRFAPALYWSGMPGYQLVYDDDPWRVYLRVPDPADTP